MVCLKLIYLTPSIVPGKCNCTAENSIAGENKQKKKIISIENLQLFYRGFRSIIIKDYNKEYNLSNRKLRGKTLKLLVTKIKFFR